MRSYAGAQPFDIPCGKCIGCRLAKAGDWATRMKHEAQLHDENSFITLTYEDAQLPADGSLSKRAIQLFFKRLRKSLRNRPVRYYVAGEYGDVTFRPHYHAILFGFQFPDLRPWRKSGTGHVLYRSAWLEKLWPFGHCEVGHVTHQSAGYCARYTLKKVYGERAASHYLRPHPVTGELHQVAPEFALMSRRPGIGGVWIDRYFSDCFPSDFIIIDGSKKPVPVYYAKKLAELEKLRVVASRKSHARGQSANATPARLRTREELQLLRQAKLKRDLGET